MEFARIDPLVATRRDEIRNLTALRFFAAFSVFLHHLKPLGIDVSKHVWHLNLGWTVSFFFVLSGFVLAYAFDGRVRSLSDAGRFIAVRFFRLWPLHVVCGALALLLVGGSGSFTHFYLFLTLQNSWVPTYPTAFFLNAVSWSISVELMFYIIFPAFIHMSVRRASVVWMLWSGALLALLMTMTLWPGLLPFTPIEGGKWFVPAVTRTSFIHLFPPVRVPEFLGGILIYHLFCRRQMPDHWVFPAQVGAIVAVTLYMAAHASIVDALSGPFRTAYNNFGMLPLFAAVIYVFAHERGPISGFLANPILNYLGATSFALYMVHQVVIKTMAGSGVFPASVANAVLAYALAALLAIVLFEWVETPARKWAKRTFLAKA